MKILFVSYGGGHIEMCLPVMQELRAMAPGAEVQVMALTTAAQVARSAGERPLGYREFLPLCDETAVRQFGSKLLEGNQHPAVDPEESLAYLGINFLEWVESEGLESANAKWQRSGRRGFLPLNFFRKVLAHHRPDVVVATNSPRSEQAAIEAALDLGIPCLTLVDLFALENDPFTKRHRHADRVTVLNEVTRANLVAAGLPADRILVTGNPAFDALNDARARKDASRWLEDMGWQGRHVVLWAGHKEPTAVATPGDLGTKLGQAVQSTLVDWMCSRDDVCLAIRYHPNEWQDFDPPARHPRLHWSVPSEESLLRPLLSADQVVVQATTVGVQAYAAGKQVVGLGFSPTVQSTGMDAQRLGIGRSVESLEALVPALERGLDRSAEVISGDPDRDRASVRVAQAVLSMLEERQ